MSGESCNRTAVCGNGKLEFLFESCDDGNTAGGDTCPADCEPADRVMVRGGPFLMGCNIADIEIGYGCSTYSSWPVCSKTAGNSPYGACDMSGNTYEWVSDWYHFDYYGVFGSSPAINPTGPDGGSSRVYRGGSGASAGKHVRTSSREAYAPDTHSFELGLRCVRDAE